jgi:UDP-2,3-diacylglucosamine pyrophosphatase LpxH
MNTAVREDRLIVVSDLHMGNRLFPTNRSFVQLARHALDGGYSLCLNGDGVDVVQMSFSRMTRQLGEAAAIFKRFPGAGLRIYYTVGNHDIVLEHFLQDWGGVVVVPFLNVESGRSRIRVEHGHMYDEMFLRHPNLYTWVMVVGRWAIGIHPRVYEKLEGLNVALVRFGHWLSRKAAIGDALPGGIPGENAAFRSAAEDVALRGFDAVVLGHTHHPGSVRLQTGGMYYNTGSWMSRPHCVVIDGGRVWFGAVSELLSTPPDALEFEAPAAAPYQEPDAVTPVPSSAISSAPAAR